MSTDPQADYIAALTELHRGLARQGPGDAEFSRELLRSLPPLPPSPRIADLGCGAGAAALLLASHFQSQVKAVDSSAVFIEELKTNARRAGLDHLVVPIHGDMAALDWPAASIDLLWSEGAAYNLGFEWALSLWRPLVANHGIAVVSEMSWFTDQPPTPAQAFWQAAYPTMATESENARRAGSAGFHVVSTRRLPSEAWWKNYYDPLRERMQSIKRTPVIDAVLRETEEEMALFERYSAAYGYTFYVMRAG
jgi:ubiquinone/menaquinone biosynthesis C-methylase UbiE